VSVWAVSWAYKQRPKRSGEKFVLVTLAQYADAEGYCYPGQGKLARLTEMGERTVRDHLASLEQQGLVESEERRQKDGRRTSNGYWLKGPPEAFAQPADSAGSSDQQEQPSSNRRISPEAKSAGHEYKASKEEPKATKRKAYVEPAARPDVDALCQKLADRIIANGGSATKYRDKPTKQAWRDPMRLLLDRDLAEHNGTAADRVARAIDWCQADDFWRGVILSPANLREHYDALRLQAQREQSGNGHRNGNGRPPAMTAAERQRALAATQAKLERSGRPSTPNGGTT
jgi:DNA-binding transcriptional ArsR family regulator